MAKSKVQTHKKKQNGFSSIENNGLNQVYS